MNNVMRPYEAGSEALNELLRMLAATEAPLLLEMASLLDHRDVGDCKALAAHIRSLLVAMALEEALHPHRPGGKPT